MGSPIVSVVMSVFNGQAFLSQAVESILSQTFRDFEFLIIDDGSTDSTAEILASYASRDGRVRILRHANKGRTASLNIGISLAKGKYIARMDADDIALPHRLKEQVEFMEQHAEVGLLGGAVDFINSRGQVLHGFRPPMEDSIIRSVMLQYNPMCHPAVVLRKEVALAAGGYRKLFAESEDYDLWLRIAERSQLANLGTLVLLYRVHQAQVSIRNMRLQAHCTLAARASAAIRRSGGADPLCVASEVSPQLLDSLGVTAAEVQQVLLGSYYYWMEILGPSDPEATLRVIDGLLQLSGPGGVGRSVLANAWLTAAGIHYRQGSPGKALLSAGRAVLARPIVAGRPVKKAFTRLAAAFKS